MTGTTGVLLFHDVTCVDEARSLLGHTPAAQGYDHRALLLAGPSDHVITSSEVDPDYLDYLHGFGLGPAPERVHVVTARVDLEARETRAGRLCRDVEWLRHLGGVLRGDGVSQVVIQPYVAHTEMERFASALRSATHLEVRIAAGPTALVRKYTSKHEGRVLAERLGLRVPEGSLIEGKPEEIASAVLDRLRRSRPLVAKGLRGAGGSLVWVVGETGGLAEFGEWLARQNAGVALAFVVEELVPVRCAVNVMVRIDGPDRLTKLGITDQRISGRTTHVGNQFPATTRLESQLEDWSLRLAAAMAQEGFAGYAGFDFVETGDDQTAGGALYFLEVNPRVNGALIPLEVTRLVNRRQAELGNPLVRGFLQGYQMVRPASFAVYRDRLRRLAFQPDRGAGVVLYPPKTLVAGVLSYVVLGRSLDEAAEIERELKVLVVARLPNLGRVHAGRGRDNP